MAEIKLSELRPAGSELLQDSESFLNELSDQELDNVVGGDGVVVIVESSIHLDPIIEKLPQVTLNVFL